MGLFPRTENPDDELTSTTTNTTNNNDNNLPSFMVGFKNGFLPRQDPLVNLPDKFYALDYILKNMPINLSKNGEKKGLLAKGELGNVVLNDLPLYDVNDINDQRFLS
ncbi:11007_t:CDS:2, partial [Entrophospora sp. SA101]